MYRIDTNRQKYETENIDKQVILQKLRNRGCRITSQRENLIEIILEGKCSSCKEIYFMALKKDAGIGLATIYRMMNLLEEIGALKWRNEYSICENDILSLENCLIELEDNSWIELKVESLKNVMEKGMESCGYLAGKHITNILIKKKAVQSPEH